MLDEPTNDLDVDTLRALEDGLLDFPGCAVVISHDRWFLDRISTHVLAFEDDAVVRWFEGNFSDYEAERHKRLGTDADQPHRLRYKPIPRKGTGKVYVVAKGTDYQTYLRINDLLQLQMPLLKMRPTSCSSSSCTSPTNSGSR